MDEKLIPARIVELLERNGALKFDELYKRVRKSEKELSDNDLNSLLMKMEIQGLVRVYRIPRGKRRIELAR
jgi:Fe2+ or Zn2+ uptake regulation protein